jgi:hypothetical protein
MPLRVWSPLSRCADTAAGAMTGSFGTTTDETRGPRLASQSDGGHSGTGYELILP